MEPLQQLLAEPQLFYFVTIRVITPLVTKRNVEVVRMTTDLYKGVRFDKGGCFDNVCCFYKNGHFDKDGCFDKDGRFTRIGCLKKLHQ